ncbi:ribonucleoprotein RB97D [Musca domestica]|uniref:RNA recognition protein n=1 Tax=Musca domestica TaxID=7370 RepID=T1PHT1_MUSDO|nr:ribonucleoprotein RB97D [Musca domestica]XP_058979526.1 ribonucleoprotein RB97D-like [Musca domestica]XP_058987425.1 ribonucleoprotein RB97D [Musca domestica]
MYNSENDHLRKLFLGGLSQNSTEDSLRAFYQKFGEVIDVTIRRDATGRSRGFGFITFFDEACVDKAQTARPHIVDGKTIDSKRVIAKPEPKLRGSGRKVFVGGLKDVHTEQALKEHFQQFGKILGIKILVDKNTGRNRGFGYIEFEDYDSADKAVLHKNHTIKYLTVDVKKSNYKPDQSRNQQQNGMQQVSGAPPPAYPQPAYPSPYGYPPAPPAYGAAPAWGAPPPATAPGGYPQQPANPAPGGYPQQPPPAYGAPPAWNGWGYGAPPAPAGAAAPPANGWNNVASPPANQNFGNYQQSYNGGPEKGGKLQANRKAPYRS